MCSGAVIHSCAVKDRYRKGLLRDCQERPRPGWYKLVLHHHRRNHQAIQKMLEEGEIMQKAEQCFSKRATKPYRL